MEPIAWNITLRLTQDRVLLPGPVERRVWVRVVLEQARDAELLAFHCPDTHGHLLLACPRALAGEVVREVEIALQGRLDLGGPFDGARIRPVRDLWHLSNAFHYVLRQLDHHGQQADPVHEASNLPDLLGLRPLGAWIATNVRRHLPRVDRASLLTHLDLDHLPDPPTDPDLETLCEAALSAACLPSLQGKHAERAAARAAVVQLSGAPSRELAVALGITPRSVHRLRRRDVAPALFRAVELQAGLRLAVPEEEVFAAG